MTLTELAFAMFWLVIVIFGSVFFCRVGRETHAELCNGTLCTLWDACAAMVRNDDSVCGITAEGFAEVS